MLFNHENISLKIFNKIVIDLTHYYGVNKLSLDIDKI